MRRFGWPAGLFIAVVCGATPAGHADERSFDVAEEVVLGPQIEALLQSVGRAYHARTGRRLYVTSGTRSPLEQADAMYDKLRLGTRLTSLYRDTEAASAITAAYRRHQRAGRARCVSAMAEVISQQIGRGCFISRHLQAGAADVRSRDMSRRERRLFRELVREAGDAEVLEEGRPPHFHLQL